MLQEQTITEQTPKANLDAMKTEVVGNRNRQTLHFLDIPNGTSCRRWLGAGGSRQPGWAFLVTLGWQVDDEHKEQRAAVAYPSVDGNFLHLGGYSLLDTRVEHGSRRVSLGHSVGCKPRDLSDRQKIVLTFHVASPAYMGLAEVLLRSSHCKANMAANKSAVP
jgi:hypothetical protein